MDNSRRDFLKTSLAGAAGAMVASGAITKAKAAWTDRMAINPNISNLRVVCCHDSSMVKSTPGTWTYTNQNSAVDASRIKANMDEMAKTLAQKPTAAEAWAAIFRKPDTKQWSEVKVAIKFNSVCCGPENTVRAAVIGKICDALIALGVQAANIRPYDVDNSGQIAIQFLTPYIGAGKEIPAGVVADCWLGGSTPAPVPGFGNLNCRTMLANGTIDILVNIGTNRGGSWCLKSHYGTFPANHSDAGYITALHKADAIIGGNPVRQQLCIMDSLFATTGGPGGSPDYQLDRLVMGTFGPTVDYLLAYKIRKALISNWDPGNISRWATDFGYTVAEYDALQLIDVPPAGVVGAVKPVAAAPTQIDFLVDGKNLMPAKIGLALTPPANGAINVRISISDLKGRSIRDITTTLRNSARVVWDGRANGGVSVPAGVYSVKAQCGSSMQTGQITLIGK